MTDRPLVPATGLDLPDEHEALARAYLAANEGISPSLAVHLDRVAAARAAVDERRLTPEDRERIDTMGRYILDRADVVFRHLWRAVRPGDAGPPPTWFLSGVAPLPEEVRAEVVVAAERYCQHEVWIGLARYFVGLTLPEHERELIESLYANALTALRAELPGFIETETEYDALSGAARIEGEELARWIDEQLTTPGGRRQLVSEWLRVARPDAPIDRSTLLGIYAALYRIDADRERARTDDAEPASRRGVVRQGTGLLRIWAQRPEHIKRAERYSDRVTRRAPKIGKEIGDEQAEFRMAYRAQPLGWAERLLIHGLVAQARQQGRLEGHPWALQRRPLLTDNPPHRVRVLFPGWAEVARDAGGKPNAKGLIPLPFTRALQRAGADLINRDRWIPQPVLVEVDRKKVDGKMQPVYRKDTLVTYDKWIVYGATNGVTITEEAPNGEVIKRLVRGEILDLHPAAVVSHLVSYVEVDNLAERYVLACRTIGCRQMRDEFAPADDYCRFIANSLIGAERGRRRKANRADANAAITAADVRLTKDLDETTLLEAFGIAHIARKYGNAEKDRRLADCFAFCRAMESLFDATPATGKEGQPKYLLHFAHPDHIGRVVDSGQGLLPFPSDDDSDDDSETAELNDS